MAINAGYRTIVLASTAGTTGTYTALCLRSASVGETIDLTDVTTYCDASTDLVAGVPPARRRITSLIDAGIQLSGHYDSTSLHQVTNLTPGETIYVIIGIDTDDDGVVDIVVVNTKMVVESRDRSFDVENPTDFSVSLQNAGTIIYGGTDLFYQ